MLKKFLSDKQVLLTFCLLLATASITVTYGVVAIPNLIYAAIGCYLMWIVYSLRKIHQYLEANGGWESVRDGEYDNLENLKKAKGDLNNDSNMILFSIFKAVSAALILFSGYPYLLFGILLVQCFIQFSEHKQGTNNG